MKETYLSCRSERSEESRPHPRFLSRPVYRASLGMTQDFFVKLAPSISWYYKTRVSKEGSTLRQAQGERFFPLVVSLPVLPVLSFVEGRKVEGSNRGLGVWGLSLHARTFVGGRVGNRR